MRALVCPISTQRTDEYTARLTALLMALMVASAALTGSRLVMAAVAADFFVRAFTGWRASPASWLAARILRRLGVAERPIDRAPKIFAARVGLCFALASAGLWTIAPRAGLIAALVLLGFALLEGVLNICAGCYVYTYLVAPRFLRGGTGGTRMTRSSPTDTKLLVPLGGRAGIGAQTGAGRASPNAMAWPRRLHGAARALPTGLKQREI